MSIVSLAQCFVRALIYCYPVTTHYWTLFTMVSFSYFLGTLLREANTLSILNSLLWGNTFILWLSFLIESLIRYFNLSIQNKIDTNPNTNWVTFKNAMPHLLDYLCGASFGVTTTVVLINGVDVSVETELVVSFVLGVFYMVMAFGKDFRYSPSNSVYSALLGLMVLRKGFFVVVCIVLFAFVLIVYPEVAPGFGLCLRSFAETGRWKLPVVNEKKVQKAVEVGVVQERMGFIGLLFNPVVSRYQLLVLERVQICLIVLAGVAAVAVVFFESWISHFAAGRVYELIGTFLELVNLKHVSYKEYA